MGLLNPGGPIAQFKRNRCSISPVELILQSGVRSHTSKMFFEVNQAVNFRVIIGGNHIKTCRKSFKTSRCERLVRIK